MENIKKAIEEWADAHMERDPKSTIYPMWNKTWVVRSRHRLYRLRLCGNDIGADIVLLTCAGGYGASEGDWSGVNLDYAQSVEQIETLYKWLDDKAKQGDPNARSKNEEIELQTTVETV